MKQCSFIETNTRPAIIDAKMSFSSNFFFIPADINSVGADLWFLRFAFRTDERLRQAQRQRIRFRVQSMPSPPQRNVRRVRCCFVLVHLFLWITDCHWQCTELFYSSSPPKRSLGKPSLSKIPLLEIVNGDSDYTGTFPSFYALISSKTMLLCFCFFCSVHFLRYWLSECLLLSWRQR